jgi:sugar phosphate isomerase/epimerase
MPARAFGVQSYCFRAFKDNAEVAAKVREIGLDKIELCGVHADFNQPDAFARIVDNYRSAGVSIISIGVQTFIGRDGEERWFECARAAGAGFISCHFRIDSFLTAIPRVRAWALQYGIRVALHTHGGYQFGGSADVAEYLTTLGGPEIGLCLDTAWLMQTGPTRGNPVEWARRFAGRIYGVHYKDFTFGPDASWKDVPVGSGNLDLPGFVAELESGGFDGFAVIEYEADPEDPVPALKACVKRMRAVQQDLPVVLVPGGQDPRPVRHLPTDPRHPQRA